MRWQGQLLGSNGGQYRRALSPATYQSARSVCSVPTSPAIISAATGIADAPTMYGGLGFIPPLAGNMPAAATYRDGPGLDVVQQVPTVDGGGILVVACSTPSAVHHTVSEWATIIENNAQNLENLRNSMFSTLTNGLGGLTHCLGFGTVGGARRQVRRPTWLTYDDGSTIVDGSAHCWTDDSKALIADGNSAALPYFGPTASYTMGTRTNYRRIQWSNEVYRAPLVNAGAVQSVSGLTTPGVYCDTLGGGINENIWGYSGHNYKEYISATLPWLYYGTINGCIYYGDWDFQGLSTGGVNGLVDLITWWVMAPVPRGLETNLSLVEV